MRTSFLIVACLAVLRGTAGAQSEFLVNTRLDSTQRNPVVAGDGTSGYVVVWVSQDHVGPGSGRDIVMRRFDSGDNPAGPESPVSVLSNGDQQKPAVTMNGSGDFIVAWVTLLSGDTLFDVRARIFRHDGTSSDEIQVNTTRPFSQTNPSVAIDEAGNWVVAWESWGQDGSDRGVYGRRFDASGTPLSGEFQIPVTTAYSQAKPVVRFLKDSRFVVIWESWSPSAGYDLFGRLYTSEGVPAGGEFPVNRTTADYQWYADCAALDDSGFVAVWCSWGQDGSDGSIVAQRFSPSGEKIGGEELVNVSAAQYQWLPKIAALPGGGYAIVWSSWKHDGDREGVFARFFDPLGAKSSFETQVNTTIASFQWEPAIIPAGVGGVVAVWSSWGQTGHDYDIIGRRITSLRSQGYIGAGGIAHAVGRSTAQVRIHVVDTLALTGQTYTALLDSLGAARSALTVWNTVTGDTLVKAFPVGGEPGDFYLSPAFEGVTVQVIPEYEFALDFARSYFANHTGSTIQFTLLPTAGGVLAPIDAILIWGSTDTLADGSYISPLDSAFVSTTKKIAVPFTAWNLTDNSKIDVGVVRSSSSGPWKPGQTITLLTPAPYRKTQYSRHVDITSPLSAAVSLPGAGDTNYVFTRRPIRPGEQYTFTTSKSLLVDVKRVANGRVEGFELLQNWPNPFNPLTVIRYTIGGASEAGTRGGKDGTRDLGLGTSKTMIVVYDLLGRQVATLVDEIKAPGSYEVRFDGSGLASGVYFYRLSTVSFMQTRKMMLLK